MVKAVFLPKTGLVLKATRIHRIEISLRRFIHPAENRIGVRTCIPNVALTRQCVDDNYKTVKLRHLDIFFLPDGNFIVEQRRGGAPSQFTF